MKKRLLFRLDITICNNYCKCYLKVDLQPPLREKGKSPIKFSHWLITNLRKQYSSPSKLWMKKVGFLRVVS